MILLYQTRYRKATPMTPTRHDLIQALSQIQNHPAFANVDILAITGCGMSDDEVRAHIERQFLSIAEINFAKAQDTLRTRKVA
jgi:hypothetical protein